MIVSNKNTAGLENEYLRILFNSKTGLPESLYNVKNGVEHLRKTNEKSGFFRLITDSLLPPSFAVETGRTRPFSRGLDQKDCALESMDSRETSGTGELVLRYSSPRSTLLLILTVTLPRESCEIVLSLTLENKGKRKHRIRGTFPLLSGLGIGENPDSDLGIAMYDRGFPGEKAWKKSGGAYGKKVSMQWQCAYDAGNTMGLAVIARDNSALPKSIGRFASGMSISYPVDRILKPGETMKFPDAGVLVYSGSWYKAAEMYGQWFKESISPRKAPEWVKNGLAVRSSDWFPPVPDSSTAPHELATPKRPIRSFEDMPGLYLDDFADLKEHAMWNRGINLRPESYGPWMSSGFIGFRDDLGGQEAFRRGVDEVKNIGRKVGMYVAGYGIRKKSPMFEKENWKKYAIINRWGLVDTGAYKKGFFCCHGYRPWQDNIVRVCRMLAEQGVDAIRLDELGQPFKPCFNRHHKHENPYDSVAWSLELLKRVREAVDEINPEINISTEFFNDLFHRYTNGALVMGYAGTGIDAMRAALPSYLAYTYHGGSGEAVITGAVPERTTAVRRDWPWSHLPGASRPKNYDRTSETDLRWHEILPSFADAVLWGKLGEKEPFISGDIKWKGHLWQADSFALITGGYDDGTPMDGEQLLVVPSLPGEYNEAWEIDIQTLQWQKREIIRDKDGAVFPLSSGLSAVFLSSESAPALAVAKGERPVVRRGDTVSMEISIIGSNSSESLSAELTAPGMISSPLNVQIPGTIEFTIPSQVQTGNYYCELKGSFLPFRRWFTVIE